MKTLILVVNFWEEFLSALMYGIVCVSCCLVINSIPKDERAFQKLLLSTIAVGAFFLGVSPCFGVYSYPHPLELMYRVAIGVFSLAMTWRLWLEVPVVRNSRFNHHSHSD